MDRCDTKMWNKIVFEHDANFKMRFPIRSRLLEGR